MNVQQIINKVTHFLTKGIWSLRLEERPKHLAALLQFLRVILLSVRRFNEDKVQLRASSLTYYSLLALVPILAMGFGIAKGFGFDKDLEQELIDNFKGHEEVLNYIITFAHSWLDSVKGGLIAGVGLALLFWSVMKMMGNIESSFNDIWQVKKHRSYVRKFTDYISMMLVAPLLIILSSSGTVYVATQLDSLASGALTPFVVFLVKLSPYVMTWLLFTLLYIIMPNTKVKISSAIVAGVLAGTAFLVVQWFYIVLQMGMSRYNIVYGSFAALPLLLIWMRSSWLIVLLGAEVSYAKQNIEQYELENESQQISRFAHRAFSILFLELIVKRFIDGKKPLPATDIAKRLKLPIRMVRTVLADLIAANLISEVCTEKEKVRAYAPAKDVRKYSVKHVIASLDRSGNNSILKQHSDKLRKIMKMQKKIVQFIEDSPDNVLIQDLFNDTNEEQSPSEI